MTVTDPAVRRYVAHLMGMPVSLALRGRHTDDEAARAAWEGCVAELSEVDRVFSTYRADSVISRLARGELDPADCPPEVHEVLALGEQARLESGGAFDVRRPGPDGVPALDPSGVVKGWAVQRASAHLSALPETDVCLSAGGDMVCQVADDIRPAWRIGIEDPHDPQQVLATVEVRHGAVATSASAHRGEHITDARTGDLPRGVASVTVVADELTWADIDATAAFAMGPDALTWLRTRTGRSGLVVWQDGRSEVFGRPA